MVSSTRTFLDDVDTEVDWADLLDDADGATLDATAAGDLQGSGFATTTTFDALQRAVTSTTPDDSVTRNTWDEGGHLAAVDVQVRGDITWTPMVVSLEHDAKGQRTRIEYPGFATDSTYDPETFRLVRLETVRDSDDAVLQDLTYTYDAAGNIVQISDAAQQTLFFDNSVVSPTTKFKYDSLYRLVSAEGREHGSLAQPGHGDPAQGDLPHDNDGSAVRTYLETYVYDEVGNILRMKHQGGTEASLGSVFWHRGYLYDAGSNVLLKTSLPGDDVEDPDTYSATAYAVNARGALVEMPHLAAILRQFDDQMRSVDLGGGDEAVYHYDAAGQRVRKVVRQGANTNERLYVGAWERFQRTTTTLQDERDTLHVMDDRRRIVRIETLTVDGGTVVSTPVPRQRFQLGNHLDSAALEVDEAGELLTYEEYHPYGTTAWWATSSSTVSQKRYRYTGMERDVETGLQRHGVRGYAPWLGRWERPDPIGLKGGINRWGYCRGNPIGRSDVSGNADPEVLEADPNVATPAANDGWDQRLELGAELVEHSLDAARLSRQRERETEFTYFRDPSGVVAADDLLGRIRIAEPTSAKRSIQSMTKEADRLSTRLSKKYGTNIALEVAGHLHVHPAGTDAGGVYGVQDYMSSSDIAVHIERQKAFGPFQTIVLGWPRPEFPAGVDQLTLTGNDKIDYVPSLPPRSGETESLPIFVLNTRTVEGFKFDPQAPDPGRDALVKGLNSLLLMMGGENAPIGAIYTGALTAGQSPSSVSLARDPRRL